MVLGSLRLYPHSKNKPLLFYILMNILGSCKEMFSNYSLANFFHCVVHDDATQCSPGV